MKDEKRPDLKIVSTNGDLRPAKKSKPPKAEPISQRLKCPSYLHGQRRELWARLGIARTDWLLAPFDEGVCVMIVVLLDELLRDPEKMKASKVAVLRACLADAGLIPRTRRRLQRANPYANGAA